MPHCIYVELRDIDDGVKILNAFLKSLCFKTRFPIFNDAPGMVIDLVNRNYSSSQYFIYHELADCKVDFSFVNDLLPINGINFNGKIYRVTDIVPVLNDLPVVKKVENGVNHCILPEFKFDVPEDDWVLYQLFFTALGYTMPNNICRFFISNHLKKDVIPVNMATYKSSTYKVVDLSFLKYFRELETIVIDGKTYLKDDVLKAVETIKPVKE